MVSRGTGSAILSGPGEGRLGTALSERASSAPRRLRRRGAAARGEGFQRTQTVSRGARGFNERLVALAQVHIINSLKLAGWHYCSLEKKNEGETDRLLPDLFLVGHGEE